MYAFLNELSATVPGYAANNDNWPIVARLMDLVSKLQNYSIRRIRVPEGFIDKPIVSSYSLAYYAQHAKLEEKLLVLNFLGNRLEKSTVEIANAINELEKENVIDVSFAGLSSQLLTEAYAMVCPSISLLSHIDYDVDNLSCQFNVLANDGSIATTNVDVKNIAQEFHITTHKAFLADWKLKIKYSKVKWDPATKPIWNEYTQTMLNECKFPLSTKGLKDKKSELIEIGTMVAELNAWEFDEVVTKKNKNAGQMRKIFKSKNNSSNFYISIDFESAYGKFELHDRNGKHLGEIKFVDGTFTEDGDPKGFHNIKV